MAKYTIEKGQQMLEKFDEGFPRNISLQEIELWLDNSESCK